MNIFLIMETNNKTKKWSVKRILVISFLLLILLTTFIGYHKFNTILSDALTKSFHKSIAADIYELKFENLSLNLFEGSIYVYNVTVQPREKPLHDYPYVNSFFKLKTENLTLKDVEIFTLLKKKELHLERISIIKPDVALILNGERHILMPYKDTSAVAKENKTDKKKPLDSFFLSKFELLDAAFHVTNLAREREFTIKNFDISLQNILVHQYPGEYLASLSQANLTVGEFTGHLQKDVIKHAGFKNFNIGIDSLAFQFTLDTLLYRFKDFYAGIQEVDIQTADSLMHATMKSFDLSYKDKSIKIKELSLQPNVSHARLQEDYAYQHTELSGSIGTLELNHINFDSIIYAKKIFIDEVILDQVKVSLFKDKTKPMDRNKLPVYPGQTISAISVPILVKQVKATNVHLDNTERKPDKSLAKVSISRATLNVENITNLDPNASLMIDADAYIEDKVHFKTSLTFEYLKPQFSFEGVINQFNLPDLNGLIQGYTPAKINQGTADLITFSGIAERTKASGTMKFLYHNLEVDLVLHEQAKWKSSVLAFTANTVLHASNPPEADKPPKIVKFNAERDMNKSFVNVVIKSLLNGLKETMIMSKENRKTYEKSVKKSKQKKNK